MAAARKKKTAKKGKAGRPAHKPTIEKRNQAKSLSGMGFNHDQIAVALDIGKSTLRKYYMKELEEGMIQANAQVAQALFKRATSGGPQSVTAMTFWLKCRAGWKETQVLEHVDGSQIEEDDPRAELRAALARHRKARIEASEEDDVPALPAPQEAPEED